MSHASGRQDLSFLPSCSLRLPNPPSRFPPSTLEETVNLLLDRGPSLEELEKRLLDAAVARSHGNFSSAARLLGITRPQLAYRLKKK